MTKFDASCGEFTQTMEKAAQWKHVYFGAAYSTRLKQAISDARKACDDMEKALEADRAPS